MTNATKLRALSIIGTGERDANTNWFKRPGIASIFILN